MVTRSRKILVTGFGAFGGVQSNPTERIVQHIGNNPPENIAVSAVTLPVSWGKMPVILRQHLRAKRWDGVLLMGVAATRPCWSIETTAKNRAANLQDATGELPPCDVLVPGAPIYLTSSWNSETLVRLVAATGLPVQLSGDAGEYLCNAALYICLAELAGKGTPAGFLHVPADRGTCSADIKADVGTEFDFDSQLKAFYAILNAMAA